MYRYLIYVYLIYSLTIIHINCKKYKDSDKPDWAKKDIRDYTEADMERLLDQWEEDEEPLEEDELPEHLRPQPQIDLSKLNMNDPENVLAATKKGRTLMTFVAVSGNPTKEETEQITKIWQTSLWNNHIQAERYLVDDNRAIFLFKDGSQAWIAKEYLVEQEKCESVTIESKVYPGKFSSNGNKDEL
ncbi:hypothetical protein ILUMI_02316 [Ignelater luminosus]|uniref:LDLR chaperone boca n=1 Tax=Ignelater luminosus TaxID=2038154 RepID=A0A8K0DHW0_IGNLU|nr:hypothetical protein ILUMI_02316 [Ignelater luminosus]